ncbi:MAG: hypothetical protein FVQ80_10875 [Planctomycetes bacterium]|nr:hypothetical protein [Planctomycetota bacterium]
MVQKKNKKTKTEQIVDYKLAAAISDQIEIENLRLVSCSCLQTPNAGKGVHSLEIDCDIKLEVDKKSNHIFVFPQFKLKASPTEDNKKEPDLSIEATFVIIYKAKSLKGLKNENFEAFGDTNGIYNAWPYWREFVQNTVARMGLPPLTIPVFRLISAKTTKKKVKKKVKSKKSKKSK